eukprot:gene29292-38364_t
MTLLHRCGKHHIDVFSVCSSDVLFSALMVTSKQAASPQGISNCLYGLQHRSDSLIVPPFLSTAAPPVGTSISRSLSDDFLSRERTIKLYRLLTQHLILLARQGGTALLNFDGQCISNSLYGLKSCTWESDEALQLLDALMATIFTRVTVDSSSPDQKVNSEVLGTRWNTRAGVPMTSQGLGSCFMGVQNLCGESNQMKRLLPFLASCIPLCSNEIDSQAVANILLGLKSCTSNSEEARLVLHTLTRQLYHDRLWTKTLPKIKSKEISMCMWGLQGMSIDLPEVQEFLAILNDALDMKAELEDTRSRGRQHSPISISADRGFRFESSEEIALLLSGCKSMHSENPTLMRLIGKVSTAMEAYCKVQNPAPKRWGGPEHHGMSGSQVAGCLYGLQKMNDHSPVVRSLLTTLTKSLSTPSLRGQLTGSMMALSLYGLQNMHGNSDEVRALLRALRIGLNRTSTDFTGQHIAMCLYGLHNMKLFGPSGGDVVFLLEALSERILHSEHAMTISNIASAMYGFKNMNSGSSVVRRIVGLLTGRLQALPDDAIATGQDFVMIMLGLQYMGSEHIEVQTLLNELAKRIEIGNVSMTGTELSSVLYSLKSMGGGKSINFNWQRWKKTQATGQNSTALPDNPTQDRSSTSSYHFRQVVQSWTSSNAYPATANGARYLKMKDDEDEEEDNGENIGAEGDEDLLLSCTRRRYRLPPALLRFLACIDRQMEKRKYPLSGPLVTTALFGLQGITADYPVVRRIIGHLSTDLIVSRETHLDAQNIANGLFGLQNMTSKHSSVRKLVRALATAVVQSSHPPLTSPANISAYVFNAQAVGNAFYGLQGMSNHYKSTRCILSALTQKVISMPTLTQLKDWATVDDSSLGATMNAGQYILSGQNIGNALWGFKSMDSKSVEVQSALSALSEKIRESTAMMDGQNFGNALYALHGMAPEMNDEDKDDDSTRDGTPTDAVRVVLSALAHKLVASNKTFSGLDVGMSLYGLRHMQHSSPEVRVILGALVHKIRHSSADAKIEMKLQELSMSIVGVLNAAPWIRDDFLSVLSSKVQGLTYLEEPTTPE